MEDSGLPRKELEQPLRRREAEVLASRARQSIRLAGRREPAADESARRRSRARRASAVRRPPTASQASDPRARNARWSASATASAPPPRSDVSRPESVTFIARAQRAQPRAPTRESGRAAPPAQEKALRSPGERLREGAPLTAAAVSRSARDSSVPPNTIERGCPLHRVARSPCRSSSAVECRAEQARSRRAAPRRPADRATRAAADAPPLSRRGSRAPAARASSPRTAPGAAGSGSPARQARRRRGARRSEARGRSPRTGRTGSRRGPEGVGPHHDRRVSELVSAMKSSLAGPARGRSPAVFVDEDDAAAEKRDVGRARRDTTICRSSRSGSMTSSASMRAISGADASSQPALSATVRPAGSCRCTRMRGSRCGAWSRSSGVESVEPSSTTRTRGRTASGRGSSSAS